MSAKQIWESNDKINKKLDEDQFHIQDIKNALIVVEAAKQLCETTRAKWASYAQIKNDGDPHLEKLREVAWNSSIEFDKANELALEKIQKFNRKESDNNSEKLVDITKNQSDPKKEEPNVDTKDRYTKEILKMDEEKIKTDVKSIVSESVATAKAKLLAGSLAITSHVYSKGPHNDGIGVVKFIEDIDIELPDGTAFDEKAKYRYKNAIIGTSHRNNICKIRIPAHTKYIVLKEELGIIHLTETDQEFIIQSGTKLILYSGAVFMNRHLYKSHEDMDITISQV